MIPTAQILQDILIARCSPWASGLNLNVSIGRKDDPTTWRLDFSEDVTKEQKKQALDALATLTSADLVVVPQMPIESRLAQLEALHEKLKDTLVTKGVVSADELKSILVR